MSVRLKMKVQPLSKNDRAATHLQPSKHVTSGRGNLILRVSGFRSRAIMYWKSNETSGLAFTNSNNSRHEAMRMATGLESSRSKEGGEALIPNPNSKLMSSRCSPPAGTAQMQNCAELL